MSDPEVLKVARQRGVAGQVGYTATVQYPDEEVGTVQFVGNTSGEPGPVVMVSSTGAQTFVTDPGRFGSTFDEAWVRRFFTAEPR